MKKSVLTCAMIAAISVTSFAQAPKQSAPAAQNSAAQRLPEVTPEQIAQDRVKHLIDQYKLTKEQVKALEKIEVDFIKEQQELRSNGNRPVPGQMLEAMAKKDEKYGTVMTKAQYTKYSASRPKRQTPPAVEQSQAGGTKAK